MGLRTSLVGCVLACSACGRFGFGDPADDLAGDAAGDAGGGDAATPVAVCDPWQGITHHPALATSGNDWGPALHPGGLVIVFERPRPAGMITDLFVAVRTTTADLFGAPSLWRPDSTGPAWSPDGTRLWFYAASTGQYMVADHLGTGTFAGPTPTTLPGSSPSFSADELELFYTINVASFDLGHAVRPTRGDPWQVDTAVASLNRSAASEGFPSFDGPGQTLYFERDFGEVAASARAGPGLPFGPAAMVAELGTANDPDVSVDGRTLAFASIRAGGAGNFDIYTATRACTVP